MQTWKFEKETNTVRTVPGNHCVVSIRPFSEGGSTDAALDIEKLGPMIASTPDLLDALYRALPFIEDALDYPVYKRGAVAKVLKQIRDTIQKADGQPS